MKSIIIKKMRKKSAIVLFLLLFTLFSSSIIFLNNASSTIHSKADLGETPSQSFILPDYDLSGTKFIEPFPYFDTADTFIASSDTAFQSEDLSVRVDLYYTHTESLSIHVVRPLAFPPEPYSWWDSTSLGKLPLLNENPNYVIDRIQMEIVITLWVNGIPFPSPFFTSDGQFWLYVLSDESLNPIYLGQYLPTFGDFYPFGSEVYDPDPAVYTDPGFIAIRMDQFSPLLAFEGYIDAQITFYVWYHTWIEADYNWIVPDDGSGMDIPAAFGEVTNLPYEQNAGTHTFRNLAMADIVFPNDIDSTQWDSSSLEIYANGTRLLYGDAWYNSPTSNVYIVIESRNIIIPEITIRTDKSDFSSMMTGYYKGFPDGTGYIEKPSLTEPDKGGGFVDVRYIQPNEDIICMGRSSIGSNSGLGEVYKKHMQIVLGEINDSRYLWTPSHDIQDSEIGGSNIFLANRSGFVNPDAFFGIFSKAASQPDTNFYPLFIYETLSVNMFRLGTVSSGYSTTPIKFYEYDLIKDFSIDIPNNEFDFTFTANPIPEFQGPGVIEPDFINRTLTGALLKVVDDIDTDGNYYEHTSYEIEVNQELASSGVFLESITFPESVYTYESMTDNDRGSTYSENNKIDMQFSGPVPQGMIMSLKVYPKIMSDDNYFTLFDINDAHKTLENDHSLLGLFEFFIHSNDPADVLKLPQRNIALQIDLLIKNDTIGEEVLLDITLDDPIIYLGDPKSPVGKDITGLHFEIAKDDLGNFIYNETDPDVLPTNSDTFEYDIPAELGNYYYASLLQDENVITYGKGGVGESCLMFIKGPVPGVFVLSSNAGDSDTNGNFDLTWDSSSGANNYSVYQYSKFITEINGSLTRLVDENGALTLPLTGYPDGTYYFIVVAHNNDGDTLSNCIDVTVVIPVPGDFMLSSSADLPDIDGKFDLTWDSSSGANNYSVFQYSKFITEINGSLTRLVDENGALTLPLTGYPDGTYYFIVVAHNNNGDTLSNCIEITVVIPPTERPAVPGYGLIYIIGLLGIMTTFIIIKKHRNFRIK